MGRPAHVLSVSSYLLQVLMLIVQAANFVGVRESNKRSYRPGGDY